MTYAFAIYIVVSGLVIALLIREMVAARVQGFEERQHLADRVMALTHPVALTHVEALRDPQPGQVKYVDEERGTTISRGIHNGDEA